MSRPGHESSKPPGQEDRQDANRIPVARSEAVANTAHTGKQKGLILRITSHS